MSTSDDTTTAADTRPMFSDWLAGYGAGRRLVLGNLSTTIADRYHTKRGA